MRLHEKKMSLALLGAAGLLLIASAVLVVSAQGRRVAGTHPHDAAPHTAYDATAHPADAVTVTVGNYYFNPHDLTITVGTMVNWLWEGGYHSVTSLPGAVEPFDSSPHVAPYVFTHTFTLVGDEPYYCVIHGINLHSGHITIIDPNTTPTPTPIPTPTCSPPSWSEQAPYPIAIEGHMVAAQGGNLYSFGGITNNGSITTTYKYTPTLNTWSPIAPLPGARAWGAAVSDGSYIYILGGVDQNFSVAGAMYRYDPATNSYVTLTNPITPTYHLGAAYLNGKLYRVAGRSAIGTDYHTEAYDIAAGTWSSVANFPYAAQLLQAASDGRYVYAGGGNDSSATYRYDPVANLWDDAAVPDLPAGRSVSASDFYNGRWIFAGGEVNFSTTTNAIGWRPSDSGWSNLPDMLAARDYLGQGGATVAGAFYAVGGSTSPGVGSTDLQRYTDGTCGTPTPTPTSTPIGPTTTPTSTHIPPTSTPTNTPLPPTNTPTDTPAAPTNTPTTTPTDCPNPFVDINGNTFYFAIHYLYCRGVVNGTDGTHFSPSSTATRGQFSKAVVLGFGIAPYTPTGAPDFTDVSTSYFAFAFIEAGFHAGILNGFTQAQCQAAGAVYPCYLPNLAITRGQVTKLVVSAAHYALVTPVGGGQTYSDVPPSNVFYLYIETAHAKNVVNGFPDGTFRPNNNIQRDQMCQIVYKGMTTP